METENEKTSQDDSARTYWRIAKRLYRRRKREKQLKTSQDELQSELTTANNGQIIEGRKDGRSTVSSDITRISGVGVEPCDVVGGFHGAGGFRRDVSRSDASNLETISRLDALDNIGKIEYDTFVQSTQSLLPACNQLATIADSLYAFIDSRRLEAPAHNSQLVQATTMLAQLIANPAISKPIESWIASLQRTHRGWIPPHTL